VMAVGVFVDEDIDDVRRVVAKVGLHAVQLHGSEPPEYCERLRLPVIKAVALRDAAAIGAVDLVPAGCTVLVDGFDPRAPGGTGRCADWQAARVVAARRRTILAGGLHAGNVGAAIAAVAPYGVDVSSGVEAAPGIKGEAKMRAFFAAVTAASDKPVGPEARRRDAPTVGQRTRSAGSKQLSRPQRVRWCQRE